MRCGGTTVECCGVIFDKDGTLIDSMKIWPELISCRVQVLQRKLGFNSEIARLAERVMGLKDNGEVTLRSVIVIGTREQTAAAVNAVLYLHLGLPWDSGLAAVLEAFAEADSEMGLAAQALPVSGALELLWALQEAGIKVAVATNDSLLRTKSLLQQAGMDIFISAYACRDEVREGKPAPDLFLLACERLGLEPKECVVVGDSLLDVKMGNAGGAGLTVGVLTGASTVEDLNGYADVILHGVGGMCPVMN